MFGCPLTLLGLTVIREQFCGDDHIVFEANDFDAITLNSNANRRFWDGLKGFGNQSS